MGDQIEMSTAENIFGSVSKFLTPQTSPRPTFSFNIGVVGRTPNSSWTPFNLMMAPIQKQAITFENKWPNQLKQRPLQMIESGFYYTGCGDRVTCFHCGITLRNWEHADNVDMEHKKHSPECKYLLMCRQV